MGVLLSGGELPAWVGPLLVNAEPSYQPPLMADRTYFLESSVLG